MSRRRIGFACCLAIGALAVVSVPAVAQTAAPPTEQAAPDPERLAIAERLVDRIWPVGTMRRMMESTMSTTVDAAAGLGDMATVWAEDGGKAERRAQHEARTGRPLRGGAASEEASAAPTVPDFNAIMAPIIETMEPPLRAAIVRIYARRYDVTQLGEIEAFFSTPTGAAYAADSLTLMNDPEMVAAMNEAMGAMMSAIPQAMMGAHAEGAAAEAAAAAVEAAAADAAADAGVVKYE